MRLAGENRAFDDEVLRIHGCEAFRQLRRIVDHASLDGAWVFRVLLIACRRHEDSQVERPGLALVVNAGSSASTLRLFHEMTGLDRT